MSTQASSWVPGPLPPENPSSHGGISCLLYLFPSCRSRRETQNISVGFSICFCLILWGHNISWVMSQETSPLGQHMYVRRWPVCVCDLCAFPPVSPQLWEELLYWHSRDLLPAETLTSLLVAWAVCPALFLFFKDSAQHIVATQSPFFFFFFAYWTLDLTPAPCSVQCSGHQPLWCCIWKWWLAQIGMCYACHIDIGFLRQYLYTDFTLKRYFQYSKLNNICY